MPRDIRMSNAECRQPEDEGRSSSLSAPSTASMPFPKTRCYRLHMEKPFDLSGLSPRSRYGRDYSGPVPNEADMPPCQGPMEYYPPPHLLNKEELRRNVFGGANGGGGGVSPTSELMANLQVSCDSEDDREMSSGGEKRRDDTSVAISTARIFRGIVVDRNGLITGQNARATRSRKGSECSSKTKQGEKSRQAAKIDAAKNMIDDPTTNASTGGGKGSDENDPSKVISLYVMGDYEELDDLVRDGAKKLRENKSLPDETFFMFNRPRPPPSYMISSAPEMGSPRVLSPVVDTSGGHNVTTSNSSNPATPLTSPSGRKRVGSSSGGYNVADSSSAAKSRSRYKQVPRSAPSKIKQGGSTRSPHHHRSSRGDDRRSPHHSTSQRHPSSSRHSSSRMKTDYDPNDSWGHESSSAVDTDSGKPQQQAPHYFRDAQCNLFPASDWTDALGFSVNSLWNCGANHGHMSPTSTSSPRTHGHASYQSSHTHGVDGAGYGGDGRSSYQQSGYHYGHQRGGGRYEEQRNPSGQGYGYDSRSRNNGVRDTVVM